jgi:hypothetical protein
MALQDLIEQIKNDKKKMIMTVVGAVVMIVAVGLIASNLFGRSSVGAVNGEAAAPLLDAPIEPPPETIPKEGLQQGNRFLAPQPKSR